MRLLSLPGARILARDPLVLTIDDFARPDERRALLEVARPLLELPRVSRLSLEHDPGVRTGNLAWLPNDGAPAVRAYGQRVASMVGRPLSSAESLQVVRYLPGERYLAHYDAYDLHTEEGRQCSALHGQRVLTTLLYLQAPDRGGNTAFPTLELEIEPLAGRLLVFEDVGEDRTRPHHRSMHEGCPVEAGEKWIASLWFSERIA